MTAAAPVAAPTAPAPTRVAATAPPAVAAPVPALREATADPLGPRGAGLCACGGGCPGCLADAGIQPKLLVGALDDPAEREAERTADAVLGGLTPFGPAATSEAGPTVRRCGAIPSDVCPCHGAGEEPATVARAAEAGHGHQPGLEHGGPAPPAVAAALTGGGHGLEPSLRNTLEARFGADLSAVRIHTDAQAAASATAIGARAYTLGSDVVFGPGQYAPGTSSGLHTLAHELSHVVQQAGGGGRRVQRLTDCTPARLSLRDCPPREAGEVAHSRSSPMAAVQVSGTDRGMAVVNFAVGSAAVKSSLRELIYWQQFVALIEQQTDVRWEILGLTDCQGTEGTNAPLRRQRADAIYALLPPGAQRFVTRRDAAPADECLTGNDSAADRTMNRSVLVRRAEVGTVIDIDMSEAEQVQGERAKFVCGPDVSQEVIAALAGLRATFAGWTTTEKERGCDALDSYPEGTYSWDIVELHNNRWISRDFQPTCATTGADPKCGETVQVGDQCYHAGGVNYVVFGTMCRLCFNHYAAKSDLGGAYRFSQSSMRSLINIYKGKGVTGLATPAPNFQSSMNWANAGYAGWAGGSPAPGDRMNCRPVCPMKYAGDPFTVHWYPNVVLETTGR